MGSKRARSWGTVPRARHGDRPEGFCQQRLIQPDGGFAAGAHHRSVLHRCSSSIPGTRLVESSETVPHYSCAFFLANHDRLQGVKDPTGMGWHDCHAQS
jgi:hypothetical protein